LAIAAMPVQMEVAVRLKAEVDGIELCAEQEAALRPQSIRFGRQEAAQPNPPSSPNEEQQLTQPENQSRPSAEIYSGAATSGQRMLQRSALPCATFLFRRRVRFKQAWQWQQDIMNEHVSGTDRRDVLLLLEHEPVYTTGRFASSRFLLGVESKVMLCARRDRYRA
jgi:hypothetical protein